MILERIDVTASLVQGLPKYNTLSQVVSFLASDDTPQETLKASQSVFEEVEKLRRQRFSYRIRTIQRL